MQKGQAAVDESVFLCVKNGSCPHLNFEKPDSVLAERDYLRARVDDMEAALLLSIEKIESLNKELAEVKEENTVLKTTGKEEREKIYGKHRDKKDKKGGKPGAPFGHKGKTREKPRQPDKTIDVYLKKCPTCSGKVVGLNGENSVSEHSQQDIKIIIETTLFRHHKYWCACCGKIVQGLGEGEIPRSYLGPNVLLFGSLLHYDAGIPYEKLTGIFNNIFGLSVTTGSLIGMDKRISAKGLPLYTELEEGIKNASVSYTDETGWKINGENHWLWHAGNNESAVYKIDPHRNHEVAEGILGNDFKGVIVSDCLGSYNLLNAAAKQKCIAHLLRDVDKLPLLYPDNPETIAFSVNLENILREGLDAKNDYKDNNNLTLEDLQTVKEMLENKLTALTNVKLSKKKSEALRKRLIRHKGELFTFLSHPEVEPTNNIAERHLRPSVISRKLSFGNKTKAGADRHAVMMSLIQTEKLQGRDPRQMLYNLIMDIPP
jgi:transposase